MTRSRNGWATGLPLQRIHIARTPEDGTLDMRWAFRKIFEKKIRQALEQSVTSMVKKRQQTDSSVLEVRKPKKRAKSNSSQGGVRRDAESDQNSTTSQSTQPSSKSKLNKTPTIQLRRCEQYGEQTEAAGAPAAREETVQPRQASGSSSSSSDDSSCQSRVLGP